MQGIQQLSGAADERPPRLVLRRARRLAHPKKDEIAHHLPWLEAQLEVIQPKVIVPLGRHALSHFAGDLKISQAHGTAVEREGRLILPLYHPAAALHRPPLRETLYEDARALGAALVS